MDIHQIVILAEKDFNNQVDGMTHWVDTSQTFSCLHFINQWLHEESRHGDKMEIMCEFNNKDFYSPQLTWLWPLVRAQFGSSRNQH